MESIFHEKQEGSLCAQHCLNSLLQGSYYTAVDLSILAKKLDEEERLRMAENGIDSEEYQNFMKQPSGNMDDSGYFSIQVLNSALQVWGLELVPYTSTDERVRSCDPTKMQAFICNYQNHWFTIRKIGNQWFNLNSLLTKPLLISDTYLALFLAQLRNEGYSIFVVFGELPPCTADEVIRCNPVVPEIKTNKKQPTTLNNEYDKELEAALKLSLSQEDDDPSPSSSSTHTVDDLQLQQALKLSLTQTADLPKLNQENQIGSTCDPDDELQRALQLSLSQESSNSEDEDIQRALILSLTGDNPEDDDRAMLRKALLLSMNNT